MFQQAGRLALVILFLPVALLPPRLELCLSELAGRTCPSAQAAPDSLGRGSATDDDPTWCCSGHHGCAPPEVDEPAESAQSEDRGGCGGCGHSCCIEFEKSSLDLSLPGERADTPGIPQPEAGSERLARATSVVHPGPARAPPRGFSGAPLPLRL